MDDLDNEEATMMKKSNARKGTVIGRLDSEELTIMKKLNARKGTVIGRS